MTGYSSEIHAVGLPTRKARGEAVEAAFLAKAATLGFGIAKTWGESERYDFIVDSGHKLWRVQVKSTQRFVDNRYIVKTRGCTERYTKDQIDFIVAYIVPENLWYVVPVSAVASRSQIYLSPGGTRHSNHEKYREAWCQMACPHDGSGPSCILLERRCQQKSCAGSCELRQR